MQQGFAIDGTLGLLLLALPIALAALAAIWAIRQSRTPPPAAATVPPRRTAEGEIEMQRALIDAPAAAQLPVPAPGATASTRPSSPAAGLMSQPASVAATPSVTALPQSPDDFTTAIASSEASGDHSELAHLYIKQASAYLAANRKEEAASRLRDAIRIAALKRLHEPHALARLELGDLYLSNGDPTTACEQWQIARNLFHDLSRPADRDSVDKRMLGNGCPTDWVLTDF